MNALWKKLESNLAAVQDAGIQLTGEKLPPLKSGGAPREEQIREYKRAELRRQRALSWKTR